MTKTQNLCLPYYLSNETYVAATADLCRFSDYVTSPRHNNKNVIFSSIFVYIRREIIYLETQKKTMIVKLVFKNLH